jgi:hypothetical protein
MIPRHWFLRSFIIALILTWVPTLVGQAARGAPGSPEFGYGVYFDLQGNLFNESLDTASNLGFDWIAINVPWSSLYPDPGASPDWSRYDAFMAYAAERQIAVLASVSAPPSWALTPQGPDANQSLQFILSFVQRYPGALQAIELFPGANTSQGWGSTPDPAAYANVFLTVQNGIAQSGSPVFLVAAGLKPGLSSPDSSTINDLDFLQGLYNAGLQSTMPVISVQMADLTGEPLRAPDSSEPRVLRHYEQVRQVMLANQHESGLIWITQLCPPSGTISSNDFQYQENNAKVNWLNQAYTQIRAQLYIGAAFFVSLNPGQLQDSIAPRESLVQEGLNYHPFYNTLRDLIAQNAPQGFLTRQGRPKDSIVFQKPT